MPDGSWNYDHRGGKCAGQCGDAGNLVDCRTGATAQALLPFLGAGQTHKQGKYKKNVEAGLYFLTSQMKVKNGAGIWPKVAAASIRTAWRRSCFAKPTR